MTYLIQFYLSIILVGNVVFCNISLYVNPRLSRKSGAPKQLHPESFKSSLASAMSAMQEENGRTKFGFFNNEGFGSILVPEDANCGSEGNLELWKLLPAIQHLPEEKLRRLPISALFQLNAALEKQSKMAGKMQVSARLAANAQRLLSNPVSVPAGLDDRRENIHPARFYGGASCSAQSLWLKARAAIGQSGVIPLGNYDLDSVGCGGCVTPKGWLEIHNPASVELKLKLFHLPNVGGISAGSKRVSVEDGSGSICIGEEMRDVADLEGFKSALNALREAMASALPWNRSVSAISGFMINTNFCYSDLAGNSKKAAVLTEFVDYILGRNALNWENRQPFLTTDDLTHVWSTWKGKRNSLFIKEQDRQKKLAPQGRIRDDICRKFNMPGGCPNKSDDCKTAMGGKLRHVCNLFLKGQNGRKCEKDHSRVDHK